MQYRIIRNDRKTLSVEITKDCEVLVRAPRWLTRREIDDFIRRNEEKILKKIEEISERKKEINSPMLTEKEIEILYEKARQEIPVKAERYAAVTGASYGRITIRMQKTRWGSCSSKGNLNFNALLMLMPDEIIDYVVVHELCHLLEMNHSKRFWNLVESILPDYRERRKWLKENGDKYMMRVCG